MEGLIASCVLTGLVLVGFGVGKSLVVQKGEGWRGAVKSGGWTLVVGGCAAGGAFCVVRLLA
jgi:hypothetical protein